MKKINEDRLTYLPKILSEFPNGFGAEIGTLRGEFSKTLLSTWSGTLYMIDVWRSLDYSDYVDSNNHGFLEDKVYEDAMNNIRGFEDRGIMVRATSEIASKMFQDESLDFVYIDANHAYDFVKQDIELWFPKVKKGGYICGHDYCDLDWYNDPNFLPNKKDKHIWSENNFYHGVFGVNPAVDEFCVIKNYELTVTPEFFGTWIIKK